MTKNPFARRVRTRAAVRSSIGPRVILGCTLLISVSPLRAANPEDAPSPEAAVEITATEAAVLKQEQYAIAQKLNEDFPNDFEALRILGFVHSCHGNLEEMFKCWQECCKLDPDRADVYDQLARHSVQLERYEDAVDYWRTALKVNPNLPGAHLGIGSAWQHLGRIDESIAELQEELRLSPRNGQAHYSLAEALFQQQEFAEAKTSYQKAVEFEPQNARAYYGLFKTCSRLGQKEEADRYAQEFQRIEAAINQADQEIRRQYDDLQQMRARLAMTCVDAARYYAKRQNLSSAERLWIRAIEVDNRHLDARTELAALYATQRKLPEAVRLYEELVQLEPDNADHFQQLGFLQARGGNLQAAEASLRQAIRIAPGQAAGYRSLAKLFLNTNQETKTARELSIVAVKLEPVAESYFVLSWACAKSGQRGDALSAIQQAIRLDPENATYRQLLEAIQKQPQ